MSRDSSVGIETPTSWTVRGSNPGGEYIFRARPDRSCGPPSLLYSGYRYSFPGVKWPGRGVDHSYSSSAEVKERIELYLYSTSGSSWPALGRTFNFLGGKIILKYILRKRTGRQLMGLIWLKMERTVNSCECGNKLLVPQNVKNFLTS